MKATLSDPRISEVLSDPVESTLFLDNLYVATASLAREKAGYSIPEIAEELRRSEVTIKAHISGATKIGRIVREAYEMLSKPGELPVRRLDVAIVSDKEVEKFKEIIKRLENENNELRKTIKKLEEEVNAYKSTLKMIEKIVSEILKEKRG